MAAWGPDILRLGLPARCMQAAVDHAGSPLVDLLLCGMQPCNPDWVSTLHWHYCMLILG